jgi:plasmid replication initiation protein
MKQKITTQIARIENRFIFNARYQLSAREQKIILYLMSNLDPKRQEDFHKQVVPVKELEALLKSDDKKWGGLYKEMNDFSTRIISKYISFDSDFLIDGKPLRGVISWFQSVLPVENEHGEVSLEFMFSERLKPFLLQLSEYAKIHPLDVAPMKSGFAIRMYQVFKAERDRMRRHTQSSTLVYTLDELKNMLGIGGKYKVLKDFRRRVLDVVEREVNTHSPSVQVKYEYIKSKRKVTGVKFLIFDKVKTKSSSKNPANNYM